MKKLIPYSVFIICSAFLLAATSFRVKAQPVPPLINYQGKLVSSNGLPVSTGDYELRFRLWDAATGGNLIWGPQVFNGQSGPGFGPLVPVVQGWFNVMLGPSDTNGAPIVNAFLSANRFFEIQVGTNLPITPRQQILSAPYALRTESASRADTATALLGAATTGPMDIYVSTNGLDTNNGFSANTAKRTIRAAVDAVPNRIMHSVTLYIYPGVYREAVRIMGKATFSADSAGLRLVGQAATRDEVIINGADESGAPVFSTGVTLLGSQLRIENITLSSFSTGINASDRSNLDLLNCRLLNCGSGIGVGRFSYATIENTVFECSPIQCYAAVWADSGSLISFIYRGQVELKNFVINYREGIKATSGATVTGAKGTSGVTQQNVLSPFIEESGGRIY